MRFPLVFVINEKYAELVVVPLYVLCCFSDLSSQRGALPARLVFA